MEGRSTGTTHQHRWRSLLVVGLLLLLLVGPVLNWFVFSQVLVSVGGSAGHGHVRDGHYFLYYKGQDTEVSEAVFRRMDAYERFTHGLFYAQMIALTALAAAAAVADRIVRRSRRRRPT